MRLLSSATLALIATFAATAPAAAQARDDLELKVTGVTFIEAPPGRDKNLTAFGASPSQEKVEINAVAMSRSLQFVHETGGFMDKGDVKVTAIFPDKSSQAFGSAELNGFPKFGADGRTRTLNLAIDRLPDRPVSGLVFEGTVPLAVATGTSKAAQALDPQRPGAFKLGGVEIRQFKVEGSSVHLEGTESLQRIKTLSFKLPSGQVVQSKRGGWQRMNADYRQTWTFDAPLVKGELQAELYEGLRTVRQPVRFVVGRPW